MRNFVSPMIQSLESRTFLSASLVSPGSGPVHTPPTPDATITADLKAVKAAETALSAQFKTDGPTLIADGKALFAAIKTARASVPAALTTKLKTDEGTLDTAHKKLWTDLKANAPAATITADKAAIKTDAGLVGADLKAIDTSVSTNAAVVAAKAKLKADGAAVAADETALQAAVKKLFTDIKNHA